MKKLKEKFANHKILIQNFFSLSALQFFNYLFPLITLPYVVRVLGPEKYGLINFAAAFAGYFVLLADYGFNLSATRQISVNRDNKEKIDEIFSSVLISKIILGIASFLLLIILVYSFELFRNDSAVYLFSFGAVISTVFFPLWIFQGLERMKYIPLIHFFPRLVGTILIFLLIVKQDDYLVLVIINSSVAVVIGIAGLIVSITKMKAKFKLPESRIIFEQLKDGWTIFKSTVSINLYTNSNSFVLGLLTNNEIVGYFSAADKIRIAVQGIFSPISQTVFPYVNKLLVDSIESFISFNKKLFKIKTIFTLALSILLFLFAKEIILLVLGSDYQDSVIILRILCWIPFLVSMSNVLGIQTMIPLGFDIKFFKIVTIAALINISLALIFVPYFQAVGTAAAFLVTEIFVTTSMLLFLWRKNYRLF